MNEWSVLLKVRLTEGTIATADLERLVDMLPGEDKGFTSGDGADFTVSFWVPAADAPTAVRAGWERLEQARAALGLGAMTTIRTHAASAAQRLTGFGGVEERVSDPTAWSVLLKCTADTRGGPSPAPDAARIADHLGPDAAVGGAGAVLVARFWVTARDARGADAAAQEALSRALTREGLEGWTIVRAHHAVAHERAEELYRGAAERAAREAGA